MLPALASSLHAAPFVQANLSGATAYDGWSGLTSANYPGYGGFPGSAPWPGPIAANQAGSGDGLLMKLAGGGYPATTSIYPFTPGTFSVSDSTPLFGLQTVLFSTQTAVGSDDGFDALPVLNYNGGDQQLAFVGTWLLSSGSTYVPAIGTNANINTTSFQWDLSGLGAITSFEIVWTSEPHAAIFSLQVDQGDTYALANPQAVPEPSTYALILLGAGALFWLRRIRTRGAAS